MYSAGDNAVLPALGFPIRESAGHWLFSASPRLIAAVHALLRLLVPRHPPCALPILTVIGESFANAHDFPVIPVGWQPIVAIGCQLAWLCSFQGPRRGGARHSSAWDLDPQATGIAPVSQNSTACEPPHLDAEVQSCGLPDPVDMSSGRLLSGERRGARELRATIRRQSVPSG